MPITRELNLGRNEPSTRGSHMLGGSEIYGKSWFRRPYGFTALAVFTQS